MSIHTTRTTRAAKKAISFLLSFLMLLSPIGMLANVFADHVVGGSGGLLHLWNFTKDSTVSVSYPTNSTRTGNSTATLGGDLAGAGFTGQGVQGYAIPGITEGGNPATAESTDPTYALIKDIGSNGGYGFQVGTNMAAGIANGNGNQTSNNYSQGSLTLAMPSDVTSKLATGGFAIETQFKMLIPAYSGGPNAILEMGTANTGRPDNGSSNRLLIKVHDYTNNSVIGYTNTGTSSFRSPTYSSGSTDLYTWIRVYYNFTDTNVQVTLQSPRYKTASVSPLGGGTHNAANGTITWTLAKPASINTLRFYADNNWRDCGTIMVDYVKVVDTSEYTFDAANWDYGTGEWKGPDKEIEGGEGAWFFTSDAQWPAGAAGGAVTGTGIADGISLIPMMGAPKQYVADDPTPVIELYQDEDMMGGYGLEVGPTRNCQEASQSPYQEIPGVGEILYPDGLSGVFLRFDIASALETIQSGKQDGYAIELQFKALVPQDKQGANMRINFGDLTPMFGQWGGMQRPETSGVSNSSSMNAWKLNPDDDTFTWVRMYWVVGTDGKTSITTQSPLYSSVSAPSQNSLNNGFGLGAGVVTARANRDLKTLTYSGFPKPVDDITAGYLRSADILEFMVDNGWSSGGTVVVDYVKVIDITTGGYLDVVAPTTADSPDLNSDAAKYWTEWKFYDSAVGTGLFGEQGSDELPPKLDGEDGRILNPSLKHLPQGVHPRLLVRAEDLDDLRARRTNPKTSAWWDTIFTQSGQGTSGVLGTSTNFNSTNGNMTTLERIQARALVYLLDKDSSDTAAQSAAIAKGNEAVTMMTEYMDSFLSPKPGTYQSGQVNGQLLWTAAIVYDWCFPLLSNSDKTHFAVKMKEHARGLEFGYSYRGIPMGDGVVTGHSSESKVQRDLLAAGIALYDEDWTFYDCIGDMINRFISSINIQNWLGLHSQGTAYGISRYRYNAIMNVLLNRMYAPEDRATNIPLNGDDALTLYKSFMYYNRNNYNNYISIGDWYGYSDGYYTAALYLNAIYGDPVLQQYLNTAPRENHAYQYPATLEQFLMYNLDADTAPTSTMPTAVYRNNGGIIARNGWNLGNSDMIVDMRIKNLHLNNHDHLDSGSFQIFYRSMLAGDSGTYESTGTGYGTSWHTNYTKSSISHNTLILRDPNVTVTQDLGKAAVGGQSVGNTGEPVDLYWLNGVVGGTPVADSPTQSFTYWPQARTLAHAIDGEASGKLKPEYSYIKGDVGDLYGGRADYMNRSMVTLDFGDATYPGAVIVYDNVKKTQDRYETYFQINTNSSTQPTINGNVMSTVNGNGQLRLTAVLGKITRTEPVRSVFGYTIPTGSMGIDAPYRTLVEPVSQGTAASASRMLNVMEISNSGAAALAVDPIGDESGDVIGARLSGGTGGGGVGSGISSAVVFSVSGEVLDDVFTIPAIDAPGAGSATKYLVTDLAEGQWLVSDGDGKVVTSVLVLEGQCAYFTADSDQALKLTMDEGFVIANWPAGSKVEASNVADNSLTLTWTAAIDAATYSVFDGATLLKDGITGLTADLSGLAYGSHTFKIEAVSSSDLMTANGPSVTLTLESEGPEPPSTPANPNNPLLKHLTDSGMLGKHPRVLIREEDLPALRARRSDAKTSGFWDNIVTLAEQSGSGTLSATTSPTLSGTNMNQTVLRRIEASALVYLLDRDSADSAVQDAAIEQGKKAVRMMREFYDSFLINKSSSGGYYAYSTGNTVGKMLYTSALTYDWCFDVMTPTDKKALINSMKSWGRELENGWSTTNNVLTGHGSEAKIQRDLLSIALATYDEDWTAADLIGNSIERFLNVLDIQNYLQVHSQGTSYGMGRYVWNMMCNLLVTRLYPIEERESKSSLSYDAVEMFNSFLYYSIPGAKDHTLLPIGDVFGDGGGWSAIPLYLNSVFSDPVIQGHINSLNGSADYNTSDLDYFLFYRTDINNAQPVSSMPNAVYRNNGILIARTGWDAGSMLVDMRIKNLHLNNHDHLDSGAFMINYKGFMLAGDGGSYESPADDYDYGTFADTNYTKSTISHSTLLLRDPTLNSGQGGYNEGGQTFPNNRSEPSQGLSWGTGTYAGFPVVTGLQNSWPQAKTLAHAIGGGGNPVYAPDYAYIKGDIGPMYNGRAEYMNRSMVTLNFGDDDVYPGAVIVYDNIKATKATDEKYFLLQSETNPTMNGNVATIVNGAAQLILTPLLGGTAQSYSNRSVNFGGSATTTPNTTAPNSADWRVQVIPGNQGQDAVSRMLNVMSVSNNGAAPLAVAQVGLESDVVVGAKIKDRVVMFSTSGALIDADFTIPAIAGSAERVKYLVADLAPGTWIVKNSQGDILDVTVVDGGQCGYFAAMSDQALTLTKDDGAIVDRASWSNGQVAATNITESSVTLTWSGAVNAVGYNIYMNGVFVADTAATVTTVDLDNLSPGVYLFTVEALSAGAGGGAGLETNDGPSVTVQIDNRFDINGKVMLNYVDEPAAGAIVSAYSSIAGKLLSEAKVGNSGYFTLRGLPAGSYYIEIDSPMAALLTDNITIDMFGDAIGDAVGALDYKLEIIISPETFTGLSIGADTILESGNTFGNLFDGSTSADDRWSTHPTNDGVSYDPTKEAYGIIDLAELANLKGVSVYPAAGIAGDPGQQFQIRVSTDGINYTTVLGGDVDIGTVSMNGNTVVDPEGYFAASNWVRVLNNPNGNGAEWQIFPFDTQARYIMIVAGKQGDGNGAYDHWCSIAEMQVIGYYNAPEPGAPEIEIESAVANGDAGADPAIMTTEITLVFKSAVADLLASEISLSGATGAKVGAPASSDGGLTWILPLSGIAASGTVNLVVLRDGIDNTPTPVSIVYGVLPIDITPYFTISGPASVVSGAGATVSYTIYGVNMPAVSGIELEFEVDGNYVSSKEFAALSGFTLLDAGNYGTPIYWKNSGNIWTGKATLIDLNNAGGGSGAISGDFGIIDLVFNVVEGALGESAVKLINVKASYLGEVIAADIVDGSASTIFLQYYSPYDVNKDGVIDLNDITYALQYLLVAAGDPGWEEAKTIDYNTDGIIDINDLILILANYTIPYYS